MADFEPYIVRKTMGESTFTFLVGDAIGQSCTAIGGEYGIMHMHNESNVIVAKGDAPGPRSTIMVRVSPFFDTPPDALKLDVEEVELAVLEVERDWIARIPRLAIEVHTDLLPPDGIARLLRIPAGRNLFVLWKDKEIHPYRGEAITERVHPFAW